VRALARLTLLAVPCDDGDADASRLCCCAPDAVAVDDLSACVVVCAAEPHRAALPAAARAACAVLAPWLTDDAEWADAMAAPQPRFDGAAAEEDEMVADSRLNFCPCCTHDH
jgi:hypothetical protein